MNKKHSRTLAAIFEDPVRADIEWRDAESLLKAMGAETSQGNGSRVRVALRGRKAVFHEPHPQKKMKKYAVRDLRDFIVAADVGG